MNAIDFGITEDRDNTRGACAWAAQNEWCGAPTVVTDYDRIQRFNPPTGYRYGARYGIENVLPSLARDSMFICDEHRLEFLDNAEENGKKAVWQFDYQGYGTRVGKREYDVEIVARYSVMAHSDDHAEQLGIELMKTSTAKDLEVFVDDGGET